jgi:hypothetical protein
VTESSADTSVVVDDPMLGDQRDVIERVLRGAQREGSAFSTSLPTTLRAGVVLDIAELAGGIAGGLLVAADYHQGLVPGVRSVQAPRGSFGVEFRPWGWLPLRSGISFGGTDRMNVALGLGVELGGFDFAVASENVTWLVSPADFSYGSLSVGTRLRF